MSEIITLKKQYGFEAAHFLPNVPEGHKCRRMHGHSFRFQVILKGPKDSQTGWLMDFADVSQVVKPVIQEHLDHYVLNDVDGLENPTSENISIWLWNRLKPQLPLLDRIVVMETCTSSTEYSGPS